MSNEAREELANLAYLSMYPDPTSDGIQPLAQKPQWEQDMHYGAADSIIEAGYLPAEAVWNEAYWQGVQDQMDASDHSSDDFGIPGGFPVRPARVNPYAKA